MSHKVLDNNGRVVEVWSSAKVSHNTSLMRRDTGWHAQRAALVCSAHEVKNGRVGNYRCEPPTFYKWNELDLPDWVLAALDLKDGEEEKA